MRMLPRLPLSKALSFATGGKRRRPQASAQRKNARPWLEALEDRLVPTVLSVNSLNDGPVDLTNSIVTLRDAIYASTNQLQVAPGGPTATGTDTILLTSGFTGTITLSEGELDIASNLTITGTAPSAITVDANEASRVFNVDDNSPTILHVSISGLTISGGKVTGSEKGGGIRTVERLTVHNCVVRDNTVDNGSSGAGIYNDGNLTIVGCTISGNTGGGGMGVYNDASATMQDTTVSGNSGSNGTIENHGTFDIQDCVISGNNAGGTGGIFNPEGKMTIEGSTIKNNLGANVSGAGTNSAILTIRDSTISGNKSYEGVAGLKSTSGSMAIINSALTDNFSEGPGSSGAIWNRGVLFLQNSIASGNSGNGGAAIVNLGGTATVQSCTLSNNNGEGGDGGAVLIQAGSASFQNTTMSGNKTVGRGGAIATSGGKTTVENCTITQNRADNGGGPLFY